MIDQLGPPAGIRIRDVEPPRPGPGDVLIRVRHGSVNHVDTFVRSGAWSTPVAFPLTVGRDAVGEVAAVGAAVRDLSPGDAVWTNSLGFEGRDGALAEYVSAPRDRVYALPAGIPTAEMAALCHPAATAWLALFRHGRLQAGQRLLVVGGGGNIGWAAVQFGVHAGARVVVSAHPRDHADLKALGAEECVDYREELGGVEPDLVLDAAGVNDVAAYTALAARRARIVLIAGMGVRAELPVGEVYLKELTVTGFAISNAGVDDLARAARHLNEAVAERGLRPRRTVVRPLAEVAAAHTDLESGSVRGKLVIRVGG